MRDLFGWVLRWWSAAEAVGVAGPYKVSAKELFSTGAEAGQAFHTGQDAGQLFHTGTEAGEMGADR